LGSSDNVGFGRLTTLKPINVDNTNSSNNNKKSKVQKPTRIIKISNHTYRMLVGHSQRFYDVESYDVILENLLRCYNECHQDKSWYHNTS
jgi:hypothetical protein